MLIGHLYGHSVWFPVFDINVNTSGVEGREAVVL